MNPPIREPGHQEPLWEALRTGVVDMIATDHAPHLPEEKTRASCWQCDCGFPGVETQMPLMLTEVNRGRMSISDYVRWACVNPAKAWGFFPNKGVIQPGADADIALVDLKREWSIDQAQLFSKSKISPWHGRRVQGGPVVTMVRGRVVMEGGRLAAEPGWGRPLRGADAGGHAKERREHDDGDYCRVTGCIRSSLVVAARTYSLLNPLRALVRLKLPSLRATSLIREAGGIVVQIGDALVGRVGRVRHRRPVELPQIGVAAGRRSVRSASGDPPFLSPLFMIATRGRSAA